MALVTGTRQLETCCGRAVYVMAVSECELVQRARNQVNTEKYQNLQKFAKVGNLKSSACPSRAQVSHGRRMLRRW